MNLDSIDAKLLEVLQENARVSISELSKRINLSLSAVSERLKKLEQSGIIEQYTTVLSPKEMNKNLLALIQLKVDSSLNEKELLKLVDNSDDILECFNVAGSFDYILKIATKNTASLSALTKEIKLLKGVRSTETNILLEKIKLKHSVSPIEKRP